MSINEDVMKSDRNLEVWVLTILFLLVASLFFSLKAQHKNKRALFSSDAQTRITGIESQPVNSDTRSPEVGF